VWDFFFFPHLKIPLWLKAAFEREGTDCRDGGNYHSLHRSSVIFEQNGLSDRCECGSQNDQAKQYTASSPKSDRKEINQHTGERNPEISPAPRNTEIYEIIFPAA